MGGSQYASVTQRSEYARLSLERLLNISWVQNMPRFWIWQGSEYEKVVLNLLQHGRICLNLR